jgi:hypothetical protein
MGEIIIKNAEVRGRNAEVKPSTACGFLGGNAFGCAD